MQIYQATEFFHELGSIQHFQNEFLKSRIVINPQWIVDVMSCLINVHNNAIQVRLFIKCIFSKFSYLGWKINAQRPESNLAYT